MPRITYGAVDGPRARNPFILYPRPVRLPAPVAKARLRARRGVIFGRWRQFWPYSDRVCARWKDYGGWRGKSLFIIPLLYHSIRPIYPVVIAGRLTFLF
jgi:hypothetical protein